MLPTLIVTLYTDVNHRVVRDQIGHNITMNKYFFECERKFQYLRATITNDNNINMCKNTKKKQGFLCTAQLVISFFLETRTRTKQN